MGFVDSGYAQAKKGQIIEFYHIPTDTSVSFKAYLTEFNDQFTSNWESEEVYGRMDPIQTFKNTNRSITLGFDIVAASGNEAKSNLSKISTLIQFLYPNYDIGEIGLGGGKSIGANTISTAPLMRVKFMNLISRSKMGGNAKTDGLVCTCNGFGFAPDIESGFVIDENGGQGLYPKLYNVSMTLTALHDHSLGHTPNGPANPNFPYAVDNGGTTTQPVPSYQESRPNVQQSGGPGAFEHSINPQSSESPGPGTSDSGRFNPDDPIAANKCGTLTKPQAS